MLYFWRVRGSETIEHHNNGDRYFNFYVKKIFFYFIFHIKKLFKQKFHPNITQNENLTQLYIFPLFNFQPARKWGRFLISKRYTDKIRVRSYFFGCLKWKKVVTNEFSDGWRVKSPG